MEQTTNPAVLLALYKTTIEKMTYEIFQCDDWAVQMELKENLLSFIEDKERLFNDFLYRCYDEGTLPFIKNEILEYEDEFPKKSLKLLKELLRQSYEIHDEYLFCSVVFKQGGKSYYYLCDTDDDLHCGDYVTVPVGKDWEEKIGRVVKIQLFREEDAPLPVEGMKYVLGVES